MSAACRTCGGLGIITQPGAEAAFARECPTCEPARSCDGCDGSGYRLENSWTGSVVSFPCVWCQARRDRIRCYDAARIPHNYYAARLDDFAAERATRDLHTDVLGLLRDFQPGDRGVCFGGPPGVGKTHLLCGILRTLTLERGIRGRYVEFAALLAELRARYERGEGEAELLAEMTSVPVLAIDELGKKTVTEWQFGILDDLISKRYNRNVTTFFATNLALDARMAGSGASGPIAVSHLEARLGDRIFSRLVAMAEYRRVEGDDRRRRRPA